MANQWLYLDVPRMRGSAVRRWQEMLLVLDYDLGKWGADGVFGNDTDVATRGFQKANGLKIDGIVGPATLAVADKIFATGTSTRPTVENVTPVVIQGVEVWDYRAVAKPPKNYSKQRAWSSIHGVCAHRTACVLGENPLRYLPVNAHVGVTMGGRLVLAHAWDKLIWHGNGVSPFTIGIEWDGNPSGFPGYYWKPGGGPHPITDAQVKASEVLLDLLVQEFEQNGQKLQYVVAHRQSSDQRELDPGWECWQKIVMPWLKKTGATCGDKGHATVWGSGNGIPKQWDPASKIPFWRS